MNRWVIRALWFAFLIGGLSAGFALSLQGGVPLRWVLVGVVEAATIAATVCGLMAAQTSRSRPLDSGKLPAVYSQPQIYRSPSARLAPNQAHAILERHDNGVVSIHPATQ